MQNKQCYIVAIKPCPDAEGKVKSTLVCVSNTQHIPGTISQFYYFAGDYPRGTVIETCNFDDLVASQIYDNDGEPVCTLDGEPKLSLNVGTSLVVPIADKPVSVRAKRARIED